MITFKQYITELFDKPYKWTLRDKHSRETVPNLGTQDVRYYFKTDDGETMVVRFGNNRREGKFRTHIDSFKKSEKGSLELIDDERINNQQMIQQQQRIPRR